MMGGTMVGRGAKGLVLLLVVFSAARMSSVSAKQEKIRLRDVSVLTLTEGQMTTGRRSRPVPQLNCVGGSAGCHVFTPNVVQCYNRGFDGLDVQWECKAEMENEYKFGKVEVTCEGYDYPEDPYILVGSCGLEYKIERVKGAAGGYNAYTGDHESKWYSTQTQHQSGGGLSTLLFLAVVGIVGYAFYKTCIAPSEHVDARSRTSDDFSNRPPPPPGFRQDYYPSAPGGGSGGSGGGGGSSAGFGFTGGDDSCHNTRTNQRGAGTGAGAGLGGAGGFWTGAATGGLLGYMFGGRNNGGGGWGGGGRTGYDGWGGGGTTTRRSTGGGGFGGFGGGGGGGGGGSRSTSGFGGTSRR